jgi:probable F420-dependent oxidoreductase
MLLPDTHGPILAPFSALATAAAVTTTLHVGNWVLANDFRNPVLVAREAATLAFLSEGRFELGFGAGRHDLDYASMGLGEVPSGGVRLSRLAESLEIIRRLLAGETLTFQGEHYSLANASVYPKPERAVPILMAASGPRALSIAGKQADIVALGSASSEQFLQQVDRIKKVAGARFEHIELASIVWFVPEDDSARQVAAAMMQRVTGSSLEAMLASNSPTVVTGSLEGMVEQLQERRSRLGLSYIVSGLQTAESIAPLLQRLAGT